VAASRYTLGMQSYPSFKVICLPILAAVTVFFSTPTSAAPFTPASDSEVVERLPGRASDPAIRRVDSLRKQLAARPDDVALRVDIARRYFDLAMAQGDPRYVGYASAALAPLAKTNPDNADYAMALGLIQQFSHAFEPALASLAKASALNPTSAEPLLWRSAIYMVQARYTEAAAECTRATPLAEPLVGAGCSAYVQATSGQLDTAFESLAAAVKASPQAAPELLLWQNTRLAEMAWRLQRFDAAESYFKTALRQGVTDQFLLGAYADFLIARQRPLEAIKLLTDWERSDILLLRLALAGRVAKDPRADDWAKQLRERFQAANQRGDRLHEQEAARFELDIEGNAVKALALASKNYAVQKEPRDAEVLMRAALAARQPKDAQPAIDWLRNSAYQDPSFAQLAAQLVAAGATK
jgi:hypothetical protein